MTDDPDDAPHKPEEDVFIAEGSMEESDRFVDALILMKCSNPNI